MNFKELSRQEQIALLDLAAKTLDRIVVSIPEKQDYIDKLFDIAQKLAERIEV